MSERSLVEAGRELCERLSSRMVKRDEAPPAMVAAQQHLCPASDFAEPPAPPGPAISFGDGLHLVGTDIQPGTYRSPATECYWERLSGVSGDFEDLITNGNGTIVEIMSSDYAFNSSRCGTWERIEG